MTSKQLTGKRRRQQRQEDKRAFMRALDGIDISQAAERVCKQALAEATEGLEAHIGKINGNAAGDYKQACNYAGCHADWSPGVFKATRTASAALERAYHDGAWADNNHAARHYAAACFCFARLARFAEAAAASNIELIKTLNNERVNGLRGDFDPLAMPPQD